MDFNGWKVEGFKKTQKILIEKKECEGDDGEDEMMKLPMENHQSTI